MKSSRKNSKYSSNSSVDTYFNFLLISLAFFSFGNFNALLIPGNDLIGRFQPQQIVCVFLSILLLIRIAFLKSSSSYFLFAGFPFVLFVCYAAASVLWSDLFFDGFLKSVLLIFNTFIIYRLSRVFDATSLFKTVGVALLVLVVSSAFTSIFVPSIGVLTTWQHYGQWSGIFQTKQDLGFAAALLFYLLMSNIYSMRKWVKYFLVLFALCCLFFSGSRGGAAIALAAGLLASGDSRIMNSSLVMRIWLMLVSSVGFGVAIYFYNSDAPYFLLNNEQVDLTGRTFIWQFALSNLGEDLIFGYGLNSFWGLESVVDRFTGEFRWFLDNFHSGYVLIFVELGAVGLLIFCGVVLRVVYVVSSLSKLSPSVDVRNEASILLGFLCLVFAINLTETYFLRSTSFYQLLFTFSVFRLEFLYGREKNCVKFPL